MDHSIPTVLVRFGLIGNALRRGALSPPKA
jgi:hypothetical protein